MKTQQNNKTKTYTITRQELHEIFQSLIYGTHAMECEKKLLEVSTEKRAKIKKDHYRGKRAYYDKVCDMVMNKLYGKNI